VEDEDCKQDDEISLGEGFMDFDVSKLIAWAFVNWVFA
jgi:hypothetical protein